MFDFCMFLAPDHRSVLVGWHNNNNNNNSPYSHVLYF